MARRIYIWVNSDKSGVWTAEIWVVILHSFCRKTSGTEADSSSYKSLNFKPFSFARENEGIWCENLRFSFSGTYLQYLLPNVRLEHKLCPSSHLLYSEEKTVCAAFRAPDDLANGILKTAIDSGRSPIKRTSSCRWLKSHLPLGKKIICWFESHMDLQFPILKMPQLIGVSCSNHCLSCSSSGQTSSYIKCNLSGSSFDFGYPEIEIGELIMVTVQCPNLFMFKLITWPDLWNSKTGYTQLVNSVFCLVLRDM